MPLRIAQCLECPIDQHGGVEVLVRELIKGLSKNEEILMVSNDSKEVVAHSSVSQYIRGHYRWDPQESSYNKSTELADWLVKEKVDIAHFHLGGTYSWSSRRWSNSPIPVVAKQGIQCVSTNHGAFSILDGVGAQRPLWYKLAALPFCWIGKIRQLAAVEWEATVSKNDLRSVQKWFFPLRFRFWQLYHSKLEESSFCPGAKEKIILCLGTVGPRKGQPILAEAFGKIAAQVPDWRLVIAGRHADEYTAKQLFNAIKSADIHDQVSVLQSVSDQEAEDWLKRAAIFAIPSLAEGLGLSLQEAMFHQCASVGSRVGGIPDLIENNVNGLLVMPGDVSSLAEALKRLITDSNLRQSFSEAAHFSILSKSMTALQMTEKYLENYGCILE